MREMPRMRTESDAAAVCTQLLLLVLGNLEGEDVIKSGE